MTTEQVTAEPQTVTRPRAPLATWIVTAVLLALLTLVMVGKLRHHDYKDAEVWFDVGSRVLHGQPILHVQTYRYPPAFAVFVAPLCAFGWRAFFFLWYALNVGLFLWSVRLARRLAWPEESTTPSILFWLPMLLVATYAADNFLLGQANLLVTAFLFWGMAELARGREWRVGLPLAITVATKVFTLPWVAYLIFRLRWRAIVSTFLACVFFMLILPAPFRGFSRNYRETVDWGERVVAPYLSKGQAGDWGQHALDYGNQSLQAQLHRFLTHVDAQVAAREAHGAKPIYVNFAALSKTAVNVVLLVLLGLLTAGMVAACGWRWPRDFRAVAAELGMSAILVLLASGIAWTYFFVMLMLPIAAAVVLLYRPEGLRASTRRMLLIALYVHGAAVVTQWNLLGGPYARSAGSVCWAAVVLFAALGRACWDLRRAELVGGEGAGAAGQEPCTTTQA